MAWRAGEGPNGVKRRARGRPQGAPPAAPPPGHEVETAALWGIPLDEVVGLERWGAWSWVKATCLIYKAGRGVSQPGHEMELDLGSLRRPCGGVSLETPHGVQIKRRSPAAPRGPMGPRARGLVLGSTHEI